MHDPKVCVSARNCTRWTPRDGARSPAERRRSDALVVRGCAAAALQSSRAQNRPTQSPPKFAPVLSVHISIAFSPTDTAELPFSLGCETGRLITMQRKVWSCLSRGSARRGPPILDTECSLRLQQPHKPALYTLPPELVWPQSPCPKTLSIARSVPATYPLRLHLPIPRIQSTCTV